MLSNNMCQSVSYILSPPQALVPGGTDTVFSYGHQTITVKLPQSMSALSKVSEACLRKVILYGEISPCSYG